MLSGQGLLAPHTPVCAKAKSSRERDRRSTNAECFIIIVVFFVIPELFVGCYVLLLNEIEETVFLFHSLFCSLLKLPSSLTSDARDVVGLYL